MGEKGKDRRYVAIDLERRGRRSKEDVTGPFYLRYGLKYESVGPDFKAAVEAMQCRQATLDLWAVAWQSSRMAIPIASE